MWDDIPQWQSYLWDRFKTPISQTLGFKPGSDMNKSWFYIRKWGFSQKGSKNGCLMIKTWGHVGMGKDWRPQDQQDGLLILSTWSMYWTPDCDTYPHASSRINNDLDVKMQNQGEKTWRISVLSIPIHDHEFQILSLCWDFTVLRPTSVSKRWWRILRTVVALGEQCPKICGGF